MRTTDIIIIFIIFINIFNFIIIIIIIFIVNIIIIIIIIIIFIIIVFDNFIGLISIIFCLEFVISFDVQEFLPNLCYLIVIYLVSMQCNSVQERNSGNNMVIK